MMSWIANSRIEGKHFIAHVKQIPGSISIFLNKLTVTVTLRKII